MENNYNQIENYLKENDELDILGIQDDIKL